MIIKTEGELQRDIEKLEALNALQSNGIEVLTKKLKHAAEIAQEIMDEYNRNPPEFDLFEWLYALGEVARSAALPAPEWR